MSRFVYQTMPINKISITTKEVKLPYRNKPVVQRYAHVKDEVYLTTQRFWASLCSRYGTYGINTNLLRSGLFTCEEIFNRIAKNLPEGKLYNRFAIDTKNGTMLGMNSNSKPVCQYPELIKLLQDNGGQNINYIEGDMRCGIVSSMHMPRVNYEFNVGNDRFVSKFNYQVPIDGYGKPLIYLTAQLERNNKSPIHIVGTSPNYKCELNLGKDENVAFTLTRALEGYNNEDGFMALQKKLEIAAKSWASIYEAQLLYKSLIRADLQANERASLFVRTEDDKDHEGKDLSDSILVQKAFLKLTGNIPALYGIVHIDALSRKKMSRLPVKCTIYDLILFASEVLDGYTQDDSALSNYIGTLLGSEDEFDLENSQEQIPNFSDFLKYDAKSS